MATSLQEAIEACAKIAERQVHIEWSDTSKPYVTYDAASNMARGIAARIRVYGDSLQKDEAVAAKSQIAAYLPLLRGEL